MLEKVKQFIAALGFDSGEGNEELLEFALADSVQKVKSICNLTAVTGELEPAVIKNATGVFLKLMQNSGQLKDFLKSSGSGVKGITQGDVSVTYGDVVSDEEHLNRLISDLCGDMDILIGNRRIEW